MIHEPLSVVLVVWFILLPALFAFICEAGHKTEQPVKLDNLNQLYQEKKYQAIIDAISPVIEKIDDRLLDENTVSTSDRDRKLFLSVAYYQVGQYAKARYNLGPLQSEIEIREIEFQHIAGYYLGLTHLKLRNFADAQSCFQAVIDFWKGQDDLALIPQVYGIKMPTLSAAHTSMAQVLFKQCQVMPALEHSQQAIDIATLSGHEYEKRHAHIMRGNMYYHLQSNKKALAEYETARELAEAEKDMKVLEWAHRNIANVYMALNEYETAKNHLLKSLEIQQTASETQQHDKTMGLSTLANCYSNLGQTDKAAEMYQAARSAAIQTKDNFSLACVQGCLGCQLDGDNSFEKAIKNYTDAIKKAKRAEPVTSGAYQNRGYSFYRSAEADLMNCFPESGTTKTPFWILEPHPSGTTCPHSNPTLLPDKIREKYQHAIDDMQHPIAYFEQLYSTISGQPETLDLAVNLLEYNARTFYMLQNCHIRLGNWEKALLTAEQSRARSMGKILCNRVGVSPQNPYPKSLDAIAEIVNAGGLPVVYLTYTESWVYIFGMMPSEKHVIKSVIIVPLNNKQFQGQSLYQFCRYSVPKTLGLDGFYQDKSDNLTARKSYLRHLDYYLSNPLFTTLKSMGIKLENNDPCKVVFITDPFTGLIPFNALSGGNFKFLSGLRITHYESLAVMQHVMNQLKKNPDKHLTSHPYCHSITPGAFVSNGFTFGCSTAPQVILDESYTNSVFAPEMVAEATAIARFTGAKALCNEEATKINVMSHLQNLSVAHLATPGSALAGFLSLSAPQETTPPPREYEAEVIAVTPEDLKSQKLDKPRLITLSTSDAHPTGTCIKKEGHQGLEQAFRLAAPQAAIISSTLSSFATTRKLLMPLFYQIMLMPRREKECASSLEAMHAALLMIRQLPEYRHECHWAGMRHYGPELLIQTPRKPARIPLSYNWVNQESLDDFTQKLHINNTGNPDFKCNRLSIDPPNQDITELTHALVSSTVFRRKLFDTFPRGVTVFWLPAYNQLAVQAMLKSVRHTTNDKSAGHNNNADVPNLIFIELQNATVSPESIMNSDSDLFDLASSHNNTIILTDGRDTPNQQTDSELNVFINTLQAGDHHLAISPEPPQYTTLNHFMDLYSDGLLDFDHPYENSLFYNLACCAQGNRTLMQLLLGCQNLSLRPNPEIQIEKCATGTALRVYQEITRHLGKQSIHIPDSEPESFPEITEDVFADILLSQLVARLKCFHFKSLENQHLPDRILNALSLYGSKPIHAHLIKAVLQQLFPTKKEGSITAGGVTVEQLHQARVLRKYPASQWLTKDEDKDTDPASDKLPDLYYIPAPLCKSIVKEQSLTDQTDAQKLIVSALARWLRIIEQKPGKTINKTTGSTLVDINADPEALWFLASICSLVPEMEDELATAPPDSYEMLRHYFDKFKLQYIPENTSV